MALFSCATGSASEPKGPSVSFVCSSNASLVRRRFTEVIYADEKRPNGTREVVANANRFRLERFPVRLLSTSACWVRELLTLERLKAFALTYFDSLA